MTRRVLKFPNDYDGKAVFNNHPYGVKYSSNEFDGCVKRLNSKWCPGDLLWVRENWAARDCDTSKAEAKIEFQASPGEYMRKVLKKSVMIVPAPLNEKKKWKPNIHLPKEASRIWLEVTNVQAERLQDISRGDCMAEGCPFPNIAKETDPKEWFSDLWKTINGPESWEANPWVWVVEFKVLSTAGKP